MIVYVCQECWEEIDEADLDFAHDSEDGLGRVHADCCPRRGCAVNT